ncbi:helix-turn-helix transcriptional regulator [Nakamurella leprariae]|uniref:Helix-turn-helix domain-containing protein n=1 Tax=Nakamurella leprariae TaxID=2803911 RepID=A0A939C1H5_9ACTN|nr:helix-turn-helix domain-containing protein [Nakamurella leprariae]MBM9467169.1 helix-turn-helix domain-containing protein [Nakamurella leprariae]
MNNPAILDTREAEAEYRIKDATWRTWRSQGKGPAFIRAGGRVLYRREDIERWLDDNKVGTIDQPAA